MEDSCLCVSFFHEHSAGSWLASTRTTVIAMAMPGLLGLVAGEVDSRCDMSGGLLCAPRSGPGQLDAPMLPT
jgi:hypothetical protein